MLLMSSGPASCQDKSTPFAKGTVGKLLPIPEEYKKADVVAYFTLEKPEGKTVEKARTVVVTVRKDTKVERIEDGKRVAAKAGDIKEGQRIELYELEDGIQIGESMRIAGRSIVVEDKRK
jgi:hypothetical protein